MTNQPDNSVCEREFPLPFCHSGEQPLHNRPTYISCNPSDYQSISVEGWGRGRGGVGREGSLAEAVALATSSAKWAARRRFKAQLTWSAWPAAGRQVTGRSAHLSGLERVERGWGPELWWLKGASSRRTGWFALMIWTASPNWRSSSQKKQWLVSSPEFLPLIWAPPATKYKLVVLPRRHPH